jgi:malate dehydrogenase (oxaloacetate-decarboxylating)(NADP+)
MTAPNADQPLAVRERGLDLLDRPLLNKGTAFTDDERDRLGLRGLLPARVSTMEEQVARVLENYGRKTDDLERYIQLTSLLDRNETLFYRVLGERLEEMLPIVYTPTVGVACARFGRIFRRARGLYVTPADRSRLDAVLANWPQQDVDVIVVTDGERILGLGDLGAGGMGICVGKISLYVAGGGVHPGRTLPVCLDVGTDNAALRADPLYLGTQAPRLRGPEYDALVAEFLDAVARRWPDALVQFEDFGKDNAARLLGAHRDRVRCFNDDIQGTGAVTAAGVLSGLRQTGGRLADQRVVISGAGSAGVGIARALAGASIWMLDSKGLLTADRERLSAEQRPFARAEPAGGLLDVVRRVRPTILIGTSGAAGSFTPDVLSCLDGDRPMVFPLSNPTSHSECTPAQALAATGGRAIVATGSPFPGFAQCNNMYVFPGVGLGVVAVRARRVTDAMFRAAAETLSALAPTGALYPPLRDIRRISAEVAFAVAKKAVESGLCPPADDATLRDRIARASWEPRYRPYRPAD